MATIGFLISTPEEVVTRYDTHARPTTFLYLSGLEAALHAGMIDEGLVPIETNIDGSSTSTLDYLIHTSRLRIFKEVVMDDTRFVVLRQRDHPSTGRDKTFLCFAYDQNVPGLLYQALGEFARRGINLTKVESRPKKQSLGQYIFLIDCEGHRENPQVKEAIEALASQVSMLKILGSYPRWQDGG